MQRLLASLLIPALLYFAACTLAIQPAFAQEPEAKPSEQTGPQIAVLLPLRSAAVNRQADAVRLGVLEAAKVDHR